LVKEHFHLKSSYESMSPVLVPQGFTKDYLDDKIQTEDLIRKIQSSYRDLSKKNKFILAEGTGHVGVGSIIQLNNAQVAKLLNLPVVLIASGGLGSAFDELTLNKTLCDIHQVKVLGVILNRVKTEKREMILHYMQRALQRWNIPLIGCIPYDVLLSNPSINDFEALFNCTLISGQEFRLKHFNKIRLVATSVDVYRETIVPNQLIITPANREDIILATLSKHWEILSAPPYQGLEAGMILTGDLPPRHFIVEELKKAHIPVLYTSAHSHTALEMINSFTAKIRKEDQEKINEAVEVVGNHIDFDLIFDLLDFQKTTLRNV
jgi:phosphate acetyltransferase